jgi:hypothetical protein
VARSRFRRVAGSLARSAADRAADGAGRRWHTLTRPYRCGCNAKDCKGSYRWSQRHEFNKHANGHGYWRSKAAQAMGRKLRDRDRGRRNARAGQHTAGRLDHRGRMTPEGRNRPDIRGGPKGARQRLRDADLYHRYHRRADERERQAENEAARGRHEKAQRLRDEAARLRDGGPAADRLERMADRADAKGGREKAQQLRERRERLRDGHYNKPPRTSPMHPSREQDHPPWQTQAERERTERGRERAPRGSARQERTRTTPPRRARENGNGTRPARTGRTRT